MKKENKGQRKENKRMQANVLLRSTYYYPSFSYFSGKFSSTNPSSTGAKVGLFSDHESSLITQIGICFIREIRVIRDPKLFRVFGVFRGLNFGCGFAALGSFAVNHFSLAALRRKMILPSIILLGLSSSVQAAHGWSRYEEIVMRSPFGKEPPPEEMAAPVRTSGEFAKQYRLCMLYQNTDGQLKAGLVSKTNNKNTFLQVGESDNGLSLVEVRLEEGIAVLQKNGETAQIFLEGLDLPTVLPGIKRTPESSGERVAHRNVSSGHQGSQKSYSFLQPVRKTSSSAPVAKVDRTGSRNADADFFGSDASSSGRSAEKAGRSAGQQNGKSLAGRTDSETEEQAYKRIIVTSSKKMPEKFAFIPR